MYAIVEWKAAVVGLLWPENLLGGSAEPPAKFHVASGLLDQQEARC